MTIKRVVSKGREYFYHRVKTLGGEKLVRVGSAETIDEPAEKRRTRNLRELMRDLLAAARGRALAREFACDLTIDHLTELLRKQDYRCAVSGLPLQLRSRVGQWASRDPWRPSIDRINPNLGYIQGNCRLVCVAANVALNEWGDAVLHELAEAIVEKKNGKLKPENGKPWKTGNLAA